MDRKRNGESTPRRIRLRSDSSIHSSTTRRTTSSQATMKRNHVSNNTTSPYPLRKAESKVTSLASPKKTSSPKKTTGNNNSSNSSSNSSTGNASPNKSLIGKNSTSPVRRKNNSPKSSVSKRGSSKNNGSPNQSQSKRLSPPKKQLSTQVSRNRKESTSSVNTLEGRDKIPSPKNISRRNQKGSPNKSQVSGKMPRVRNSPNTLNNLNKKDNVSQQFGYASTKSKNVLNSGKGKKLVRPVSNIQIARESQKFDETSQSNNSNVSPFHDSIAEEKKDKKDNNEANNEMDDTESSSKYTPKYNLHLALNNCKWEDLYNLLKELSENSDEIFSELDVMSNDDASVLHTACWKAPIGLILLIIKLLPTHSLDSKSLFLKQDKDGNTPLHLFCANIMPFYDENSKPVLDISVLKTLISRAPEVLTIQNIQGETPLHLFTTSYAASKKNLAAFQPSSAVIAKVSEALGIMFDNLPSEKWALIKDNTGATPFHSAIVSAADEAILIPFLDYCPAVCKVEDGCGMLPLHYAGAFLNIQASVVKRMIEIYQYGPCHKSKFGDTPLHVLVRNSADDIALNETDKIGKRKLLNRNAIQILELLMGNSKLTLVEDGQTMNEEYDPLFITNIEQLTPIHCCALFNASIQTTQIIMAHPSAEKAALVTNAYGSTPLHLAAAQPNVCVDISIAIGTADSAIARDKQSRTPLHIAALNKNATTGLIECIVDLNSSCCEIIDEKGNLPLHTALQSGAKEHIVEALLKAYPEGIETRNKEGNSPLHEATKSKASIDVVKMLIDQFKDAVFRTNKENKLPVQLAVEFDSSAEVVDLLIECHPISGSLKEVIYFLESSKK